MTRTTRVRGFAPWAPQLKTQVHLDQVTAILEEYRAHLPLTIRQIFYRLVGRFGFDKTENAYGRLCETLRDMFLDGESYDFDIADNVDNYFRAVRDKWPKAWADTSRKSGILPKTNAFRAFMRHLKDVYPGLAKIHGRVVPVEGYSQALVNIDLKDGDLTSRNFKPGSSGESAFYKVLAGKAEPEDLFEQLELPLDGE